MGPPMRRRIRIDEAADVIFRLALISFPSRVLAFLALPGKRKPPAVYAHKRSSFI